MGVHSGVHSRARSGPERAHRVHSRAPPSVRAFRAPPRQQSPQEILGGGYPPWPTESPYPPWRPSPRIHHGRPSPRSAMAARIPRSAMAARIRQNSPSSLLHHGRPSSLLHHWSRNGTALEATALSPCPLRSPGRPPHPSPVLQLRRRDAPFREGEVMSQSPVQLHCIFQHPSGHSPALSQITHTWPPSGNPPQLSAPIKLSIRLHSFQTLIVWSRGYKLFICLITYLLDPCCSVDVFLQWTPLRGEIRTTNSSVYWASLIS